MPSSDPTTIPKILDIVAKINPSTILDVGPGNGRYGFLFREILDWNYGRLRKEEWKLNLSCIEIDRTYITPIHHYIYDSILIGDWLYEPTSNQYDLIFMGDVLEHWPDPLWKQALARANEQSAFVLVVSPNWKGSLAQKSWHGHHQEKHWAVLSPQSVGGRCLYANSKLFICAFDNVGSDLLEDKDVCF